MILEERVPVFSVGVGKPSPDMIARCRARDKGRLDGGHGARRGRGRRPGGGRDRRPGGGGGRPPIHLDQALLSEMATIGTLALLPQVVDAVRLPVVAAGGIMDGRQLAAALVLGASGVLMGTRFIATRESGAPEFYKQALVDRDSDDTTITDAFTGLYARVLRTPLTEEYRASGAPVVPVIQQAIVGDITAASAARGNGDFTPCTRGRGWG